MPADVIESLLQAFVTFFITLEPVALVPVFAALSHDLDGPARRRTAVTGVTIATLILLVFAVAGQPILKYLGIGLPALRVAGGALLFLLAVDMVFARESGLRGITAGETTETRQRHDLAVFPLAIPLIAGPAAITAVILLMSEARGSLVLQAGTLAVLLSVLAVTLGLLLMTTQLLKLLGITGVNVLSRVFGVLLAALAAQFILDGLAESALFTAAS